MKKAFRRSVVWVMIMSLILNLQAPVMAVEPASESENIVLPETEGEETEQVLSDN